jgi:signal peptidase I
MRRLIRDVLLPCAVAVALAFVIQASVAKPYEIPTGSMIPTIQANDRIIANRLIYRFRSIDRGDIIVFSPPKAATETCAPAPGVPFVKRVIGIPGDHVVVSNGTTYVNGKPFVVKNALTPEYDKVFPVVPAGDLLVLGDNRPGSCDSHQWVGRPPDPAMDPFVPESNVIGEAEVIYWPALTTAMPHLARILREPARPVPMKGAGNHPAAHGRMRARHAECSV